MTRDTERRERAAVAATLSDAGLLDRVRAAAGREVGDPLNNPHDNVKLREQFDLTVEFTHSTVFAFNDDGVCAALKTTAPDAPAWARRAACVAVASMWTPAIGKAYHARSRPTPPSAERREPDAGGFAPIPGGGAVLYKPYGGPYRWPEVDRRQHPANNVKPIVERRQGPRSDSYFARLAEQ
ncbi:MAG: hypothetical protein RLZZ412_1497 [Verrucomicrobiota bacterium]